MITYNHEKFIAQALESALEQRVSFDYEIVVGDDCSTDDTREILIEFQKRHSNRIRLLLHTQNLGLKGKMNFIQTLGACRGEYIALLEGDDFWTSSHKLQRQADFLDQHPGCSVCFHNANIIYENGDEKTHPFYMTDRQYPISSPPPKSISTIQDIIKGNFIITCTTMFRAGLIERFPEWFCQSPVGDWPLFIMNALHGYLAYIGETMASYRIHEASSWSSTKIRYRTEIMLKLTEEINQYLDFRYHDLLSAKLACQHLSLSKSYLLDNDTEQSSFHAKQALKYSEFGKHFTIRQLLRTIVLRFMPRFYPRHSM